jgi:hypothetical protein
MFDPERSCNVVRCADSRRRNTKGPSGGLDESMRRVESQRSGLNRRPLDYESSALPLSYAGIRRKVANATVAVVPAALRVAFTKSYLKSQTLRVCSPFFPRLHACPGTDSNRDALRHHPLKMACLPISPPGHLKQESVHAFRREPIHGSDGARTRDLSSDSRVL